MERWPTRQRAQAELIVGKLFHDGPLSDTVKAMTEDRIRDVLADLERFVACFIEGNSRLRAEAAKVIAADRPGGSKPAQ
jgi:hypothetical protein